MLDQTTTLLVAIVTWTIAATMLALRLSGLSFPIEDLVQPVLFCFGLSVAAWWYRRVPSFRLCLTALAVLVAFSTVFVVLTYALGATRWPFADRGLAWCDTWLGFPAGDVTRTMNSHPWLQQLMWLAYFSVMPQTTLLIVVLGLRNSERLVQFLLQFMLCGWVTAACFYFVPALGTCGVEAPPHYQGIVRDLVALRNGALEQVTWRGAEGIIVFPSFHVVWAVLLIVAFRWWPFTVWNVLMIVSTIPIGLHYGIDVIGGLLVCGFVVPIANRLLNAVNRPSAETSPHSPTSCPTCQ